MALASTRFTRHGPEGLGSSRVTSAGLLGSSTPWLKSRKYEGFAPTFALTLRRQMKFFNQPSSWNNALLYVTRRT